MAKKIYIAIYENKEYEFDSWAKCENFVKGKPNILFKGFSSIEDAQPFILNNIKKEISFDLDDVMYAYVDGSVQTYEDDKKVFGYGLCVVKNREVLYEEANVSLDTDISECYQIGGELFGALKGVEYAIQQGEERVILVYDYMGIEMFANKTWKARRPFVEDYVTKMNKYMNMINIDFVHVNSHINDGTIQSQFNNRADKLAKNVCIEYLKNLGKK